MRRYKRKMLGFSNWDFFSGQEKHFLQLGCFLQFSHEFLICKGRTHLKNTETVNFTGPQTREMSA